jgi:hypothetical protein
MEAVDDELATLFLQYLSGKELGRLSCCSKRWLRLTTTAELWRNALAREFGGAWPTDAAAAAHVAVGQEGFAELSSSILEKSVPEPPKPVPQTLLSYVAAFVPS